MPRPINHDTTTLRRSESGAISNPKVERYVLMLVDGVLSPYKCWVVTHSSKAGSLPTDKRRQNIHSSSVFKERLEELMAEKEELTSRDIWGELEWQARQSYRRACALEDLGRQIAATNQLMQIALKGGKPAKVDPANDEGGEEAEPKRGRGAPAIESPVPSEVLPNYRANKLVDR